MSNQINYVAPVFPTPTGTQHQDGMTLRQYAAIKLAVPDSGLPWLDEMIVQSRRFNIDDATLAIAKMNLAILEAREESK